MDQRCEFVTGYDITIGQKPLLIKCSEAAAWRKTPLIFGGGINACDDCWQKWSAKHEPR